LTATQEAFLGTTPGVWLCFSPADDRLYVARDGAGLEEWDVVTRRETGRYRGFAFGAHKPLSVSADGRVVVFADEGKVVAASESAGRAVSIDLGSDMPVRAATVTPDGRSAVAVFDAPDERLAVMDVGSGRVGTRLDQSSIGVLSAVVSPDGAVVAVVAADGVVRLFATTSGKKLNSFDADPKFRGTPRVAFSPDSQKVYVTGHANGMVRFAVNGKSPEAMFQMPDIRATAAPFPWVNQSPAARISGIAVGADGSMVALGTHTGELRVLPSSGGRIVLDMEFFGRVHAVAFSTDGRVIAVALADGSVHLVPIKG
jgi:WD40 repeat protein